MKNINSITFFANFTLKIFKRNGTLCLKGAIMLGCQVTDFPNLPNYKLLWVQMVLSFTNNPLNSSNLGGKSKYNHFYPKINASHNYF